MKKEKIIGKLYDRTAWFWAVMHKRHITAIYPRYDEARREVFFSNQRWEKLGWGREWYAKRFKYHFRGTEIDAYEHEFKRKEKKLSTRK